MKKKMLKAERVETLITNIRLFKEMTEEKGGKAIIGIDSGRTSPGLAVIIAKGPLSGEVLTYNLKTKGKGFDKVMEVEKWIRGHIETINPMMVVMEDYARESRWGREEQGEMQGVIMRLLWRKGIPLVKVAPPQIKAFVGAATKDLIIKEIYRKWEIDVATSDEADAVVLTKIGLALLNIVKGACTLSNTKDFNALESKPHAFFNLTQKEARTAVNIIISRGEEANGFAQGRKKTKEERSKKKTTKKRKPKIGKKRKAQTNPKGSRG